MKDSLGLVKDFETIYIRGRMITIPKVSSFSIWGCYLICVITAIFYRPAEPGISGLGYSMYFHHCLYHQPIPAPSLEPGGPNLHHSWSMRIQRPWRWGRGSVRASPGWGPTPAAAPRTGPLWRERSTVTLGLRGSFPTCPCLTQRHSPLGADSTERRVHSGFIFEQMRVTTPASLFKPEEEPKFKWAGAVSPCGSEAVASAPAFLSVRI